MSASKQMASATRQLALYQQIARRIADEVTPVLSAGSRLPSERVLCKRFAVSRVTLRAALGVLSEQGALTSSAARGWFVAPPAEPGPGPAEGTRGILGFSETAATQGQVTVARVLHAECRPASLDEAESFGIVAGSAVFELRRLRFLEGLVIAVDNSRLPLTICPHIDRHDFTVESLYRVLRTAQKPVIPTVADYAVEAVPASREDAALLELPEGMPLLVASQKTADQFGLAACLRIDQRAGALGLVSQHPDRSVVVEQVRA